MTYLVVIYLHEEHLTNGYISPQRTPDLMVVSPHKEYLTWWFYIPTVSTTPSFSRTIASH